jgi:hypothetical protein
MKKFSQRLLFEADQQIFQKNEMSYLRTRRKHDFVINVASIIWRCISFPDKKGFFGGMRRVPSNYKYVPELFVKMQTNTLNSISRHT